MKLNWGALSPRRAATEMVVRLAMVAQEVGNESRTM